MTTTGSTRRAAAAALAASLLMAAPGESRGQSQSWPPASAGWAVAQTPQPAVPAPGPGRAAGALIIHEIPLAGWLDRHWTAGVRFEASSAPVFVSATLDRAHRYFIAVYVSSAPQPRFLYLADSLDMSELFKLIRWRGRFEVGSATCVLFVDIRRRELVLEAAQGGRISQQRAGLSAVLEAESRSGASVVLFGRTYAALHQTDLKDDGSGNLDPGRRSFVLVTRPPRGAPQTVRVSEEEIPIGRFSAFRMVTLPDGRRAGFQIIDNALRIIEIP